jgi:gluconokinase
MNSIVVMGVCGAGKSSVGRALAERLRLRYIEGDEFHPPANVAKMAAGTPLNDDDRAGWLDTLAGLLGEAAVQGEAVVLSCSALKRAYRDRLRGGAPFTLVYLHGERATLEARMAVRQDHFMPASLLDSQLATLEVPGDGENVVAVAIEHPLAELVEAVLAALPRQG